jgi:hypothetical protein
MANKDVKSAADSVGIDAENTAASKPNGGRVRLLTLDDLDGRTKAYQHVRDTRAAIASDLGGDGRLSTLERCAADHAALLSAVAADAAARWLRGEPVDILATLIPAVNSFNRTSAALGWQRRQNDVTLAGYLETRSEEGAAE